MLSAKKYIILTVDGKQPNLKKFTQQQRIKSTKIKMDYLYKVSCLNSFVVKLQNYLLEEKRFNVIDVLISNENRLGEGERKCVMYRNYYENKFAKYNNLHIIFSNDSDSLVDCLFITNNNESDTMIMIYEKHQVVKFMHNSKVEREEKILCYWLLSIYGNDYIPPILQSELLLDKLYSYVTLIMGAMPDSIKGDFMSVCERILKTETVNKQLNAKEIKSQKRVFLFLFYCIYALIPNMIFTSFTLEEEERFYVKEFALFENFKFDKGVALESKSHDSLLYECIFYHVFTTLWYLGYITNTFLAEGEEHQRTTFFNVYKPDSLGPFHFDDRIERANHLPIREYLLVCVKDTDEEKLRKKTILYNIIYLILYGQNESRLN